MVPFSAEPLRVTGSLQPVAASGSRQHRGKSGNQDTAKPLTFGCREKAFKMGKIALLSSAEPKVDEGFCKSSSGSISVN